MRIAYCVNLRLPSERAYGHHVARFCDALAACGADVTIFAPERRNPIAQDFWSYHGVRRTVRLRHVPAFDGIASQWTPGVIGLWLHTASFVRHLLPLLRAEDADVLYTRTPALLAPLLSLGKPVVLELHTLPRMRRRRFVRLCMRCHTVICLTTPMRDALVDYGVPADRVSVEGDAVDRRSFEPLPDRHQARMRFGIPMDARVLGYAGSLATMGLSKGVEQIVEAVAVLRSRGTPVHALIAGGPASSVSALQSLAAARGVAEAVRLTGQLPHAAVRDVLAASDVLIYPAPASRHPFFVRDTSPLKLFEYMASLRPIVAADLPPVHDILDADTAVFCAPGDSGSLADAAMRVLAEPEAAALRAQAARERVQAHTWEKRAERILSLLP